MRYVFLHLILMILLAGAIWKCDHFAKVGVVHSRELRFWVFARVVNMAFAHVQIWGNEHDLVSEYAMLQLIGPALDVWPVHTNVFYFHRLFVEHSVPG